jgi:hypothetical protein
MRFHVFAALIVFAACSSSCGLDSAHADRSEQLIGTWDLRRVAGQSVSHLGLHDWQLEFGRGGSLKYRGAMTGTLAGMQVNGKGRWQLQKNTLRYNTEGTAGASIIRLSEEELTLTPDPILVNPGNRNPVETVYVRHRGI